MDNEEIILQVIIKTSKQSIYSNEKEGLTDIIFNFHEGDTTAQIDRAIGKIIREIITDLLDKGELPF